jgi:hypothetical protein
MATLFGIYYVNPVSGEKRLCEEDGGTYYERAFALESDAIAYANAANESNLAKGWGANYIAAPLPTDVTVATYEGLEFEFDWKLIGGDRFTQVFQAESLQDAIALHFNLWGVTVDDCEIFIITQTEESEGLDGFFEVLLANAKKGL